MFKSIISTVSLSLALIALARPAAAFEATSHIATQLLSSGRIDLATDTVTVPLHHGHLKDRRDVWYVLIDASDKKIADEKKLVYAPGLAYAKMSARQAYVGTDGEFVFDRGAVDFSPARSVTAGDAPNLFPPKAASPGSMGDAEYSPYVVVDGVVYNAPTVAFGVRADKISFCHGGVDNTMVHDKAVAICPETRSVTLALSHGFASGQPLVYVSLDANNPVAAAMEGATYAPTLAMLVDSGATLPLYAVTNGETGKSNPSRQGFDSALSGDGSPLNVLTGIPTLSQAPYSPLWDLHIAEWTTTAIQTNKRTALTSAGDFVKRFQAGELTNFGGGMGVLPSSGLLVNCPAIAILK